MKKYLLPVLVLIFTAFYAQGQSEELVVKNNEKGLYLEHKVAPKQSFFAIGRLYNAHPKAIAAFNDMDINKGLAIGQVVNIPLTDTNFTQKSTNGTPVYYKVGDNEGLMKVSSLHRNVTLESLRNWNKLADNTVRTGARLVVGFLVSAEMKAVASTPKEPVAVQPPPVVKVEETRNEETIVKPEPIAEKKEEATKIDPVTPLKEEPKEVKTAEPAFAKQQSVATPSESGYFKSHFDLQTKQSPIKKNETVTSGVFKTTSGWVDSKYYLLIDGVQPGTVIRIINPSNNKVVYAKVLGEMSGIRQNAGLNIRISSAAASALQVTEEDKFIVKVSY